VGGATSTYAHDGDGKRASSTVGGVTTRSVYDAVGGLPMLLDDGTRKYVYGLGLAYAVSGSTIEVYHTDGLGSVRALTDAAGQVTATYRTDEFGVPTATTGSSGQPFGYTGEQRDSATEMVYLRARMYDPAMGRFIQRDPYPGAIGAPLSLNRFSYVQNNPINLVDPSGLDPLKVNKILREQGADNDCFVRNQEGTGYYFNLRCSNPVLVALFWQLYQTPWGPRLIAGVYFAAPGNDGGGGDSRDDPDAIKHVYPSKRAAPQWPKEFEFVNRIIVEIKNTGMLARLREHEPGRWVKVMENGYLHGRKVSVHYSRSRSGKVFDVEVHEGWSVK
jgi:RHS repeat-associated protein